MTRDELEKLITGTPVMFRGKEYEWGYAALGGGCVLYHKGERNMQDSFAVSEEEITLSPSLEGMT